MRSAGGKVEIGAIIGDMVDIYRDHFGPLIGVSAAIFIVVGLLQAGLYADGRTGSILIGSLIGLIGATLYAGFVVKLVEDLRDGRRDFTVGELFESAAQVIGSLLINGVLKAIAVVVGLVLLIVPGVWLLTIWVVTAPVIVIERKGGIAAFGRSVELVRGRGWDVFGVVVVSFVIAIAIAAAIGLLGAPLGNGGQITVGTIGSIFAAPITALVAAILYFQLTEREREAQAIAAAPAPAPAV
jgi:hypothetical protein